MKRGQKARVEAGFSPSSCAYGYKVVRGRVDAKGRNVNGVREIDEAAAAIILRIYRDYITGQSISNIVAALNAEGIPSPSGGLWKRNMVMGGLKKQEGVLRNEIYTGKLIYNRSYLVRDPISRKKRQIALPEDKWTRVYVPHLRIVSDDVWQQVRQLDQANRERKHTTSRRPLPDILNTHNQHALTGWVRCGRCGGVKSLASDSRYVCSNWRYARTGTNSRGSKEPELLDAVFSALLGRTKSGADFRPVFLQGLAEQIREHKANQKAEQETLDRIKRLLAAVERGIDEEHTVGRITELQQELSSIRQKMEDRAPITLPSEAELRSILYRHIGKIRISNDVLMTRTLFKLLVDKVTTTPIESKESGETVQISLQDDGWFPLWKMSQADEDNAV